MIGRGRSKQENIYKRKIDLQRKRERENPDPPLFDEIQLRFRFENSKIFKNENAIEEYTSSLAFVATDLGIF